ncbi:hypothetical protein P5673_009141 [Acropora cervicornis]|uniref:Uncharacterized protein n=1 Tax=Acropora cervicornis TaxID=6130 RepID=A0AAD9V9R7_ACRCE|nr:hypothetical protein P5673_009141 [Acropora cervicornis]
MRRVSVASVPSIHMFRTPARKQEEQLVHCLGQTAKLYVRSGFFDDEKPRPRGRRSSLMPPIPSARSSAMSMKSSSSRESNEYLPSAAQGSKEESDIMICGDKKKDEKKAKNNYKLRKISKTETSNLPN